jgi:hypothetical protein
LSRPAAKNSNVYAVKRMAFGERRRCDPDPRHQSVYPDEALHMLPDRSQSGCVWILLDRIRTFHACVVPVDGGLD